MLRAYSRAIYNEITQDAATTGNTSKLIPVILDQAWEGGDSVPSLFRGGTVYNLSGVTCPRKFVYTNKKGHFERLVCRMAGINRDELDKLVERMLHRLPKHDETGWCETFFLVNIIMLVDHKAPTICEPFKYGCLRME